MEVVFGLGWCLVDWFVLLSSALTYTNLSPSDFVEMRTARKSTAVLFIFVMCEADFDLHKSINCMSISFRKKEKKPLQYLACSSSSLDLQSRAELRICPEALVRHKC